MLSKVNCNQFCELSAQPFAIGILVETYSVLPMLLSWQVGFGYMCVHMFAPAYLTSDT
jgi:hypothetical protein